MKTLIAIALITLPCLLFSCQDACEKDNTYEVIVRNSSNTGTLQVNVDDPFTSVNGPGQFSVAAGETLSINVSAGTHTILARMVVTVTVNNRTQTTVTGQPDEVVDQGACETVTLVY